MAAGPGPVVLFGSGETSPSGRRAFEWVLGQQQRPVRLSVLETPAGFEVNSARVAGRVADFIREHLQNHRPQIDIIPARKRGTPFSPDDPDVLAPMQHADALFLGPGSPTYAVRQLTGSLAWEYLTARHQQGAALVLASAATIAVSARALPVYEIYKVGEDAHWKEGLDLLGSYGLHLVFVPHWNNAEGGEELDTSHCFMGKERFGQLLDLLSPGLTVVGIDEHTALALDLRQGVCEVLGRGGVTLLQGADESHFHSGETFELSTLGEARLPAPSASAPPSSARMQAAETELATPREPPTEILQLVAAREEARGRRDWALADSLRQRILSLGWQVSDTRGGPVVGEARQSVR